MGNQRKNLANVMEAAWDDAELRHRLAENPRAVLKEKGIVIPEGAEIEVHYNTSYKIHLVLPQG